MQSVESLKNEGNQKYANGDVNGAIDLYKKCLERLPDVEGAPEEKKRLEVTVFTNLSLAYITQKDYDASCECSKKAITLDPSALKAHMRFVEARRLSGYPFDAFVHSLLHVRPILREDVKSGKLTVQEMTKTLHTLEDSLSKDLGLLELSHEIELIQYNGGVDMISRGHFKANDILFIEKKYSTNFGESDLNNLRDLNTERICEHFAVHLRKEQESQSEVWSHFRKQFYGAWPRSLDEVDEEAKLKVGDYLRNVFPDLEAESFNELLILSLMCRYNCFHSGFFRVCALANHNCQANIAMKYNNVDRTVTMIAVSDIKPGEMLNVKYLSDAHFLMGLGKRREFLRSWLFWCSCSRCKNDTLPGAIQEHIKCPSCGKYEHMAVPGDTPDQDPLISLTVRCRNCGNSFDWDDPHRAPFRELLQSYMASSFPLTQTELCSWMRTQLKTISSLKAHPANWIFRMVFYFFVVPLTSFIGRVMNQLRQPGATSGVPLRDIAELCGSNGMDEYYFPLVNELDTTSSTSTSNLFSLKEDDLLFSDGKGPECLRSLVVLWHLIKDFYPVHEMWSIHVAICDFVLLLLLFQDRPGVVRSEGAKLSAQTALTLLQRHGPFIGTSDEGKWLHTYNMFRSQVQDSKALPNLNKIKSAFMKPK